MAAICAAGFLGACLLDYPVRPNRPIKWRPPADTVDVDSLTSAVRIGFIPDDMLLHPTREVLFAVNRGMGVIAVVDFAREKLLLYHYLDHAIGYPDVKCLDGGCFLFVPGYDGSLTVFDADSHDLVRRRMVGQRSYSLAASSSGKIYISEFWAGMMVYDFPSDSLFPSRFGFRDGRLHLDGSETRLFLVSMNSSPEDLAYFALGNDGTPVGVWSDKYHGDYPLDDMIFEIPPKGHYLISASEGALYQADTSMRFLGRLPDTLGNPSYFHAYDYTFSESGDTVFAAMGGYVGVYSLNPPRFLYAVAAKGLPRAIAKRGNRILSLSMAGYQPTSCFLEVLDPGR